jgi:hypothetical protein
VTPDDALVPGITLGRLNDDGTYVPVIDGNLYGGTWHFPGPFYTGVTHVRIGEGIPEPLTFHVSEAQPLFQSGALTMTGDTDEH